MALTKLTKPRARWTAFKLKAAKAVSRSLYELLLRVGLTPADFGAKGDGVTDDTGALVELFNFAPDGSVIDLEDKKYLIYKDFEGVSSGDAVPINKVLGLYNKKNITVKNGEIFCHDPKVSGKKVRYPNTMTINGCTNIKFRDVILRSKGESYGDADASVSLGREERRAFLAQNSGCAIFVGRSKTVHFDSCEFYRCGSVGAFYVSSSADVRATNCHASADSLGYAAYCMDSWCGGKDVSGYRMHDAYLTQCTAYASAGFTYGSKGCLVTEDSDVYVRVDGGYFADAYANGGAPQIGNAFGANVSHVEVNGATVHNCACVGITGHSAAGDAILIVSNVKATGIRTAAHIQMRNSFGVSYATYNDCEIDIDGSKVWQDKNPELQKASVIANMKVTTPLFVTMNNCKVTGVARRILTSHYASYGGFKAVGCEFTVTDYISEDCVWGSATEGDNHGIEFLNSKIIITSTTTSDEIDKLKNKDSNNVYTQLYLDYTGTIIESKKMRQVFGAVNSGKSSLLVKYKGTEFLHGCYDTGAHTGGVTYLKYIASEGQAGSFYKRVFELTDNHSSYTGSILLRNKTDNTYSLGRVESAYQADEIVGEKARIRVYVNGDFTGVDVNDTVIMLKGKS